MARRRLFSALILTGPTADEVDGLRRALGSAEIDRIPAHITLAAPVNVPEDSLEGAVSLLRGAAARSGPIAVTIGPPASFWPVSPVCYLAVSGDLARLEALHVELTAPDGPLAPPPGRTGREFVPHVTVNQNIDPGRIPGALESLAAYRAAVSFERLSLLEHLDDERRWVLLADAVLGPPAVRGRGGIEVTITAGNRLDPAAASWAARAWARYSLEQYGPVGAPDEPFVLVARSEGGIAGVAEGELRPSLCRLARLIVGPEQRGLGIGSRLLAEVEQLALVRSGGRVRLETVAGGRSEGFYRGRGYEVTASLPRWRGDRDFVVMERSVRA